MSEGTPSERLLQVLLAKSVTTATARKDVRESLTALGVEVTGEGLTTFSGRIAATDFHRTFGLHADPAVDLPVPRSMEGLVRSITVAPPHTNFD